MIAPDNDKYDYDLAPDNNEDLRVLYDNNNTDGAYYSEIATD